MNIIKEIIKFFYLKMKYKNIRLGNRVDVSLDTNLNNYVYIGAKSKIGSCRIGKYSYIGENCSFERTTLGSFCSIGPQVVCGLASHPVDFVSTYPGFYSNASSGAYFFGNDLGIQDKKNVWIGNDVWIGARVIILGGINIGDGAIIAAGSVVTKDIEPYSIVGGVPAKLIKKRFREDQISRLLEIKWWDKDEVWLKKNMILINDIDKFLDLENKNEIRLNSIDKGDC